MRIPPSPPIALVSLSLLAVPVSMADTTAVSYTHLTLPTTPYV